MNDYSFGRRSRKKFVIVTIGIVISVGAAIFFGSLIFRPNSEEKTVFTSSDQDQVRRFIDGVFVSKGMENVFPVGIMIENLATIRPQKGLQSANIVTEALAEGGITRLLAIYASGKDIVEIGPVRSSRGYFLDLASEFHGAFAHIGGSPDAQKSIKDYPLLNIDALGGDHQYFWRSKTIGPPHNLFTSTELISRGLRDKKSKEQGDFDPWKFQMDEPFENGKTKSEKIAIDFSSASYAVEYHYQGEGNVYERWNGGAVHEDGLNNKPILVKNILVQFVESAVADSFGRLEFKMRGNGKALLFRDGIVIDGAWEKGPDGQRTQWKDSAGNEMTFNAGPTWIEIVPNNKTVTY